MSQTRPSSASSYTSQEQVKIETQNSLNILDKYLEICGFVAETDDLERRHDDYHRKLKYSKFVLLFQLFNIIRLAIYCLISSNQSDYYNLLIGNSLPFIVPHKSFQIAVILITTQSVSNIIVFNYYMNKMNIYGIMRKIFTTSMKHEKRNKKHIKFQVDDNLAMRKKFIIIMKWIKKYYIIQEVPGPLILDAANIVYPYESTDVFRDESLYKIPIQ